MGNMMGYIYSVFIACFLLMTVIPAVSADEDSIAVFLFIEDKEDYVFGESLAITVHVFDKGDYLAIPDSVAVTVNATKNIPLTATSDGIYEGTYELNQSDAIYTYVDWHLYFAANASLNLNWDTAEELIVVPKYDPGTPELNVVVDVDDPKDRTPRPGDDVALTITVAKDDTKLDPEEIYISTPEGTLDATRTETGIYTATYSIPKNKVRSEVISLIVNATYNDDVVWDYVALPLDFLNVWLHNASVGKTHADFEIWVTDLEGRAVPGAGVFLSAPKSGSGASTNEKGKAVFSLDYTEPSIGIVELTGEVSSPSEETQTFSYSFLVGELDSNLITTPGDFEVFPVSGDRRGEPQDEFAVRYVAYNNTELWTNETIHYYAVFRSYILSTEGIIIDYGSVNTDDNGRFDITFTAPNQEGYVLFHFKSAIEPASKPSNDNYRYKEATDTTHITVKGHETGSGLTPDLDVSIDELVLGGKIEVTATMSGSSGYHGKVFWEMGDDNWTWLSGKDFSYLTESDNKFSGSVYIPEFLPLDQEYAIVVSLTDLETGVSYYNLYEGKPIGVAPEEEKEEEGLDILTVALIIIVIVVVIVLFVAASKGEKAKDSKEEPKEEEEEADDLEEEDGKEEKAEESGEEIEDSE